MFHWTLEHSEQSGEQIYRLWWTHNLWWTFCDEGQHNIQFMDPIDIKYISIYVIMWYMDHDLILNSGSYHAFPGLYFQGTALLSLKDICNPDV